MANKRRRETCIGLRSADIETRQGSGPVAEDVAALSPRAVTLSSGGCSVQRVGLLFSSVANRRHGFESDSNAESRRWLSFCAPLPRSKSQFEVCANPSYFPVVGPFGPTGMPLPFSGRSLNHAHPGQSNYSAA